jgi:hypothetical protein
MLSNECTTFRSCCQLPPYRQLRSAQDLRSDPSSTRLRRHADDEAPAVALHDGLKARILQDSQDMAAYGRGCAHSDPIGRGDVCGHGRCFLSRPNVGVVSATNLSARRPREWLPVRIADWIRKVDQDTSPQPARSSTESNGLSSGSIRVERGIDKVGAKSISAQLWPRIPGPSL